MLVHLHQYSETDANDVVRSGTDVDPETDKQSYFDVADLELDEWERVERDDDSPGAPDLPGRTLQLRMADSDTATSRTRSWWERRIGTSERASR